MIRQPVTKRQRRLGIQIFPKADKYIARRPHPPGVHGASRKKRTLSEYGLQTREKQRAKFIYGLNERQFHQVYRTAENTQQNTGEMILQLLERRLDNVIYRSRLAATRPQARQWISHGLIQVNSRKVKQPSYSVDKSDTITINLKFQALPKKGEQIPKWLKVDPKHQTIAIVTLPVPDNITTELETQLIVESYSR